MHLSIIAITLNVSGTKTKQGIASYKFALRLPVVVAIPYYATQFKILPKISCIISVILENFCTFADGKQTGMKKPGFITST